MLDSIKENVKTWNWRSQTVGEGEDMHTIANIIDRIDRGYYKTKEVSVNLETIELGLHSFDCPNLFEFLTHYKLVEDADLKYPVVLNREGTIIDGRHRMCKAILKGKKTLKGIMILDSKIV